MNEGEQNAVNHPPHYNAGRFEVIDVIEDWKLSFNLGNAVKYIARAEHKGRAVEDLKKALWYLIREIAKREPQLAQQLTPEQIDLAESRGWHFESDELWSNPKLHRHGLKELPKEAYEKHP